MLIICIVTSFSVYGLPYFLNQQGVLKNLTNDTFVNGTHLFNITVFNGSDSFLFSLEKNVTVNNGVFDIFWDNINPRNFIDNLGIYYRVKVGVDNFFGKTNFTSVPYSFVAEVARNVSCSDVGGAGYDVCVGDGQSTTVESNVSVLRGSPDGIITKILRTTSAGILRLSVDSITNRTIISGGSNCSGVGSCNQIIYSNNVSWIIRNEVNPTNSTIQITESQISGLSPHTNLSNVDVLNIVNSTIPWNGSLIQNVLCSQIIFDNGMGSSGICDGVDAEGSSGGDLKWFNDETWLSNSSNTLTINQTTLNLTIDDRLPTVPDSISNATIIITQSQVSDLTHPDNPTNETIKHGSWSTGPQTIYNNTVNVRVGIGVSEPNAKLVVDGNVNITGNIQVSAMNFTDNVNVFEWTIEGGNLVLRKK